MTSPASSALIIIDMQNDFVLPNGPVCVAGAAATVPRVSQLLSYFRQQHRPVFHVVREHRVDGSDVDAFRKERFATDKKFVIPGTAGCEIVESLQPIANEYRLVKPRFSAFMQTELDMMLRRLAVTQLVICGTQYPNCIRATVLDAVSLDYPVTLVTDATSAQTADIAAANILDMVNIGVSCLTTHQFITERH